MLYDHDPAFQAFYEALSLKLQRAFRSSRPPVIVQGEPVIGLEAAAASLIAAGDTVPNLAAGVYSKGFGFWARRWTENLVEIEVAYDPAAVAAALQYRRQMAAVSISGVDAGSLVIT